MALVPPRIPRKPRTPEEGSFDALRDEGVRLIAQHSGQVWTDYNLHDPGLTILEQLCYGLTDLIYRSGFDVADHLTGPEGTIDFERQGLHLPMDILPSRPTTARDFRKRLIDEIEGLDDAWIVPWSETVPNRTVRHGGEGLYVVVLRETVSAGDAAELEAGRERLRAAALRVFLENRNLCEDIQGAPIVAEALPYRLVADIEIGGPRPPGEILDDIYNVVEAHVTGRPTPDSAERRLSEGATLDQLLDGPSSPAGVSLDRDGGGGADYIFVPDVIARVQAIRGVAAVRDLALEPVGGPATGAPASTEGAGVARPRPLDAVPRILRVSGPEGPTRWLVPVLQEPPGSGVRERVRLWKDGRPVAEPADFPARYRESAVKRRRRVRPYEAFGAFYAEPAGEYRDLGEYHSIQEHFPPIYGVGSGGLPVRASTQELSSARQLKAYLLVLEQVMANFVANLASVRGLFSTDQPLGPTYRYLSLDEDHIPGLRELYPGSASNVGILVGPGGPYLRHPDPHLRRVREEFDDHLERRGRLFDQMLAMFGETHSQSSLRRFGRPDGGADVEAWVVENKARFLREIVRVTRDRVGAADFGRAAPGEAAGGAQVSGFALRLGLLLGLDDPSPRPLAADSAAAGTEGFHVIEHLLLRPTAPGAAGADDPDRLWSEFYPLRMSVVFPDWIGRFQSPVFRLLVEDTVHLNCPAHVLAECLWLGEPAMKRLEVLKDRFERLYGAWLGRRLAGEKGDTAEMDASAHALTRFLVEARRQPQAAPGTATHGA